MSRRRWIKQTESITLQKVPGSVRAARRVFKKELSPQDQMTLVREMVETRAAELCRAYKNVIAVSYGFGRKRRERTQQPKVVRTPCVTFIVKKKWNSKEGQKSKERLPEFLFGYWTIKRKRKLCAVPTDVEDSRVYSSIRLRSVTERVAVKWKPEIGAELGAITCAIRRSTVSNKLFAASCRHVFSISKRLHPQRVLGAKVHVNKSTSSSIIGETRSIMGKFQNGPSFSFDAQLTSVSDPNALGRTLAGLTFPNGRYAKTLDHIPDRYFIITPRGRTIKAEKVRFVLDFPIPFNKGGIQSLVHELLIETSSVGEPTQRGDSGSPVVTERGGGMLLGMLIAGSDTLDYLIPAWQLLDPANFDGVSNSEKWRLVNP